VTTLERLLAQESGSIADLIHAHALVAPRHPCIILEDDRIDYAGFDALMDRVALALQRDGVAPGECIAISGTSSIAYAAVHLGATRAGVAVAPLQPSVTPDALVAMIEDTGARHLFLDKQVARHLETAARQPAANRISLDDSGAGLPLKSWLGKPGESPVEVAHDPFAAFNVIYSSGTTGKPKGIVQPNRMRWAHVRRYISFGFGRETVNLVSTPLYSNTTLVSFLPALGLGATVIMMPRFDAHGFLRLAQKYGATHAPLVPVQFDRILRVPELDTFDLSSFRLKFSTSAHFPAALKAEALDRWPGGLIEVYGMTEGGGTCILYAHDHRDKLHTVGKPAAGHDIRVIDDDGHVLPQGSVGEVVGRSISMMTGYHNAPEATAAALWFDEKGQRFIRTGDLGRFDEDGFLVIAGRKKDIIISGGFNIYAVDLETVLAAHPAVAEAAVVGVASQQWGETPVAFVVLESAAEPDELKAWANERLGKTQRLSAVQIVGELPRNPIGKVLKRELREKLR
jgi:long-chain acyl-CoA synthetase